MVTIRFGTVLMMLNVTAAADGRTTMLETTTKPFEASPT